MNNKDNKWISECCKATLSVKSSDEGTSHYVCDECGKPANPVTKDNKPEWEKKYAKEFHKHYEGILQPKQIETSIQWHLETFRPLWTNEISKAKLQGREEVIEKIRELKTLAFGGSPSEVAYNEALGKLLSQLNQKE